MLRYHGRSTDGGFSHAQSRSLIYRFKDDLDLPPLGGERQDSTMPVPKRRTSKRVKNQRRAHDALTTPQWSSCANCGETVLPHRACSKCGYYRGRAVLKVAES